MIPRLHVVTDDGILAREAFGDAARAALRAGGREVALHIRGPGTSGRRLHEAARDLRAEARETGSLLVVNDRVDVVLALGLPAAQLGGRSLPVVEARRLLPEGTRIGASVHGVAGARHAAADGADWLLVGTIWPTTTHPERDPAGPGLVEACVREAEAPALAIGGVTPERVGAAVAAGAHGAAVVSGVWSARDAGDAVRRYLDALETARTEGR